MKRLRNQWDLDICYNWSMLMTFWFWTYYVKVMRTEHKLEIREKNNQPNKKKTCVSFKCKLYGSLTGDCMAFPGWLWNFCVFNKVFLFSSSLPFDHFKITVKILILPVLRASSVWKSLSLQPGRDSYPLEKVILYAKTNLLS